MKQLIVAMLASAVAPAAIAQDTPRRDDTEIVVTGRTLAQTEDALAACIARDCPPDEDISATLAHAENLFVEGEYRFARTTLAKAIGRNGDEAKRYPVPVSDLYRANARVAAHLGEGRSYQLSTLEMRDALLAGLADSDPRLLAAEIEVADSRARLGYPDEARRKYDEIAQRATRLGVPRVAGFARIRGALNDWASARENPNTRRRAEARAAMRELADQGATAGADIALLAEVVLARFDRESGNTATTDALVGRLAALNGSRRPLLIDRPEIKLPDQDIDYGQSETNVNNFSTQNVNARAQTTNVERRWVDIGFLVTSEGRVSEAEILRHDGTTGWAKAVISAIAARVYAPLRTTEGNEAPGFYMVERYTLTADWRGDCSGSRLRCRDPKLRLERLDLTPTT